MRRVTPIHGRDHAPGGSDPIDMPATDNRWAALYTGAETGGQVSLDPTGPLAGDAEQVVFIDDPANILGDGFTFNSDSGCLHYQGPGGLFLLNGEITWGLGVGYDRACQVVFTAGPGVMGMMQGGATLPADESGFAFQPGATVWRKFFSVTEEEGAEGFDLSLLYGHTNGSPVVVPAAMLVVRFDTAAALFSLDLV